MKPSEGRRRVVIDNLRPEVDCGRYAVKRIIGDQLEVTAAFFGDGHDHVAGRLLFKHEKERRWRSAPMTAAGNDLYTASFSLDRPGTWRYTVQAWVDHFDTWASDLRKRIDAQPNPAQPDPLKQPQNIPLALRTGANLLEEIAGRAKGPDARLLEQIVRVRPSTNILWLVRLPYWRRVTPIFRTPRRTTAS